MTLGKYKLVQGSEVSGFDRTTGIQIFVPIYYMLPNYAKIHVSTYELYELNLLELYFGLEKIEALEYIVFINSD